MLGLGSSPLLEAAKRCVQVIPKPMENMSSFEEIFNLNSRKNRINQLEGISDIDLDLFSKAVDKTEKELKQIISKNEAESESLNKKISNYAEENKGIPTQPDSEIIDELFDNYCDLNLYLEYLNALSEMKIVYLFKTLEINIKNLIKTAYPKVDTKDFFRWDSMTSFFKSTDLKIHEISGYNEVIELKKVNNCIKHTVLISPEIRKIKEFSSIEYFDSESIELFHNRIKKKIIVFFKGLTTAIRNEVFEFDEERIKKLTEEFKSRMDERSLQKFAEKLKDELK